MPSQGGASWPAPPSLPPLAERRRALRAAPRDPTLSHDRAVTRRASMPGLDFVKMLQTVCDGVLTSSSS
jgi:hypothetical protein